MTSQQSTLHVRVKHPRKQKSLCLDIYTHSKDIPTLLRYLKQQGFESAGMLLYEPSFIIIKHSKRRTVCNVCHFLIPIGALRYGRRFPTFHMPSDAFNPYGYYGFSLCSVECIQKFLNQWEAAKINPPLLCTRTDATLLAGVAAQNDEHLFVRIFERWKYSENSAQETKQ